MQPVKKIRKKLVKKYIKSKKATPYQFSLVVANQVGEVDVAHLLQLRSHMLEENVGALVANALLKLVRRLLGQHLFILKEMERDDQ